MKILVISYKNPSNYVLKKTFVNSLKNKFKICFVTYESPISQIYSPDEIKKKYKVSNVNFFRINKISKLDTLIKDEKPNLILSYFIESLSPKFFELYFYLKKLNIPSLKIVEQPFIWREKIFMKKIYNFLSKKSFEYDYGIICSEISEFSFFKHSFKNLQYFYNMNYQVFLNIDQKKNSKKKFNVFLDENFVFHPDIKIGKVQNIPKPNIYYKQLITWFDSLNENKNEKVMIAAHPTTKKNNFNHHPIVFNKTANFIKNSKLVILHHSSAIDLAILLKKDLLFITTNEINLISDGKYISELAKYFRTSPINISKDFDIELVNDYIVKYSEKKMLYKKFKDEFIKHPLCNKTENITSIVKKMIWKKDLRLKEV